MKALLATSALLVLVLASLLHQHLPDGTVQKDGFLRSQLARMLTRPAEVMDHWACRLGYADSGIWLQRKWYDTLRFAHSTWTGNRSDIRTIELELGEINATLYYQPVREPMGPAVMYFHGGAGVADSSLPNIAMEIVSKTKAAFISVRYSLATEFTFPNQVLEVEEAFRMLPILAWRHNISMERIAAMGEGFGANLASVLVTRSVVSGMEGEGDPRVKALILMYPALQFVDLDTTSYQDMRRLGLDNREQTARNWLRYLGLDEEFVPFMLNGSHIPTDVFKSKKMKFIDRKHIPDHMIKQQAVAAKRGELERYHTRNELMRRAQRGFLPHLLNTDSSPLFVDHLIGFPSTFLASAGYDSLRDDAHFYYRRLKQSKVDVTHKHYKDAMHGALQAFAWLESGKEMMDDLIDFIDKKL